jgi:MarR family transcriptional regulator, lower aerobic nicotinate degradation pathway regulator
MQQHGPMAPGQERRAFLEQQPTFWLKRSYQLLRRTVDGELRAYGLTLSQRDVLLALYEEGPLDQSALRERLGLEQSSVSRLVDGVVRRQLVELQTSDTDRRLRLAALTTEGRDLLLTTPGSSELGGTVMVGDMTGEERRELVRLLQRCVDNLTSHAAIRPEIGDHG